MIRAASAEPCDVCATPCRSTELYADLPKNPKISPLVRLWKGAAKPLSLFAIFATAAVGFLHYIGMGPNEVDEADEEAARRELEKKP